MESLLNNCIKCHPLSLPELHLDVEHSGTSLLNQANNMMHAEKKNEHKKKLDNISSNKRKHKKMSTADTSSDKNRKLQQPTILDVLMKAGTSQEVLKEDSLSQSLRGQTSNSQDQDSHNFTEPTVLDVSAATKALEAQRFKFRPLLIQCFSLLTFSQVSVRGNICSKFLSFFPLYFALHLLWDSNCRILWSGDFFPSLFPIAFSFYVFILRLQLVLVQYIE